MLNLKKVISGIDKKDNARVTYHDALAALYKMKQGQDESNSEYLERFRSNVNTAELAQASNVFCSPALMKVAQDGKPTDQEINDEEEASMAILLLKNSDPKRYSSLSKKIRKGTFLSRDEYPVTVSAIYELMTIMIISTIHRAAAAIVTTEESSSLNKEPIVAIAGVEEVKT